MSRSVCRRCRSRGADGEPGEDYGPRLQCHARLFRDPAATARRSMQGWLHKGDIGVLDEEGFLRITDRKKDLFIVGGSTAIPPRSRDPERTSGHRAGCGHRCARQAHG
ncbi:MAG: AMP-binding protein [Gammaproteobacteria bacterium]|nr:AMP-binding protein [Gammaproteobacteria bacterium]